MSVDKSILQSWAQDSEKSKSGTVFSNYLLYKSHIDKFNDQNDYRSTDYGDELTWAAAWLYKATGDVQYLDEAEHFYENFRLRERPNEFFYNKKVAGVQV